MFYLYAKANERHSLLEETIGPNNLEIKSITTIWILLVGGITMIGASIPLEIIVFLAYNYYCHPWKRFISTDAPIDYSIASIESIGNKEHPDSKEHSTPKIDKNDEKDNFKINDTSEASQNDHLNKDGKVDEEKIRLKTRTELSPLDEAYEILEKQLESLRLLQQ